MAKNKTLPERIRRALFVLSVGDLIYEAPDFGPILFVRIVVDKFGFFVFISDDYPRPAFATQDRFVKFQFLVEIVYRIAAPSGPRFRRNCLRSFDFTAF